ncbi:transmembrane protein 59-like isoform X1 [Rhea pennata]|uniref:transmembrane protein 59-like isoform X1 n=1 Tax=Rhea pennata TaxID=8795 RepID=UPI002E269D24
MAARGPRALLALGLALAAAAAAAAAADPFAPQLGDTGACHARCGRSLPHRAAADAVLNACYRGCRLFSICHFVDASAGLNATRAECETACAEAYGRAEEQSGCATGCREQPAPAESGREQSPELEPPPPFSAFDLVSAFCTGIVSSAQSFISSTWTFYLQADDGRVLVFQSAPELEDPAPERTWPGSGPRAGALEPGVLLQEAGGGGGQVGAQHRGSAPPLRLPGPRPLGREPPAEEPRGAAPEPPLPEHDFLGCMSRRSGLPRWILAACLFLSVVVMLWLSCASLVTAPEQHVKTQPLSINGDQEEPEEPAGPLPVKVDLDTALV